MFLWGKNNATFHWVNEGIRSINAEISISVSVTLFSVSNDININSIEIANATNLLK